jgi:hypothetical protein
MNCFLKEPKTDVLWSCFVTDFRQILACHVALSSLPNVAAECLAVFVFWMSRVTPHRGCRHSWLRFFVVFIISCRQMTVECLKLGHDHFLDPFWCIIIIIIIILVITFMQGIYNYILETNRVSRVYNVAAVLYWQFVLHIIIIHK